MNVNAVVKVVLNKHDELGHPKKNKPLVEELARALCDISPGERKRRYATPMSDIFELARDFWEEHGLKMNIHMWQTRTCIFWWRLHQPNDGEKKDGFTTNLEATYL